MTFTFRCLPQDLSDTWNAVMELVAQLISHGYEASTIDASFTAGSATHEIVLTARRKL